MACIVLIEYSVLFQKAIVSQNPKLSKEQRMELRESKGHDMTFQRYHRYADMLRYIEHLTAAYSHLVEVVTIGKTNEGVALKVVKVSSGSASPQEGTIKPAVWIDGGMHAREWISPAVVMYVLKQLVERYKLNKKMVDSADWYLMPLANPDGYEYSHSTDRLWRKTRSNHDTTQTRNFGRLLWGSCEGVDLNRNWDFHWGGKGASDDPCHETYAGPRPFSEPESRAISEFLMDHKDRIKLYLTLHSEWCLLQMWLLPWGFTSKKVPDYDDMYTMGRKAVEAISKISGTQYQIGSSTSLLYPSSGGSDDWAKGVAGIKYAYTVELRDRGSYGFLLPASQIIPTGKETFAAIKSIARAIVCKT
uniref:(California timema) hypothetical protein n=1 Tax=Timema californicum TaxID=61474 RepID=A0A7R9JG69_TIMCA|nr:unnamed protein product [Timema californicum]